MNEQLLYVGTFTEPIRFGTGEMFHGKGEGIHIYSFDTKREELRPRSVARGIPNPSYLTVHRGRNLLFTVNELKEYDGKPTGTVSAYSIDDRNGSLSFLSCNPTHGTDPCHITTDAAGDYVLASNFMSGSVVLFPVLSDGSLGDASDFHQHEGASVHPQRQSGPHAHSVVLSPDEQFVFVPDLGLDAVKVYRFERDKRALVPCPDADARMRPGAGPRHLVFDPSARFAFVVNELDSTVVALKYDADSAALAEIETYSTLPGDFSDENTCSGIQITPDGRFLYVSNRGHDSIAVFAVDESDGSLRAICHQPTGGKTPRGFAITADGNRLIAGNQNSDTIAVFSINQSTGNLTRICLVEAPTPVCIIPTTYTV